MAINDWNPYPERRPLLSGSYLVVTTVRNAPQNIKFLVTISEYHVEKHEFEFDALMKARNQRERIYAWMPYKTPPKPPKK